MEKQKTSLEKIFDFLVKLSASLFFISIFLKVWIADEHQWILNRIWVSSLIIFLGSLFMFGLCCYKSDNNG